MKKLFIIILGIVLVVGIVVGTMFTFKICPPAGPWPMPPWCGVKNFTRNSFEWQAVVKPLQQIKAVNMADTWGANYNFGMFENTRRNIESSFDRVKELGASEVYVHDFHRAIYDHEVDFTSTSYKIVDEIFLNDFRDESMTVEDLEKLATAAHARGLKIGVKHNMSFVNIGKYIVSGLTGGIDSSVKNDLNKFNEGHSEVWVRDFFDKWQTRLVERGKMYQAAGFDTMSITPTWMGPAFVGQEKLANELWKNLITDVRVVFTGKIHVEASVYGWLDGKDGQEDWLQYDYYKLADITEVRVYSLPGKYNTDLNPTGSEMRASISRLLDDLENRAKANGVKLSVFFAPFSYFNALNEGIVEFYDVLNPLVVSKKQDWQYQANAYQAFFEELSGRSFVERIIVSNFWWDDAMDPEVKPRISISGSFRNKIAEAVVSKWFNAR